MNDIALPYRLNQLERLATRMRLRFYKTDEVGFTNWIKDTHLYRDHRGLVNGLLEYNEYADEKFYLFDYYHSTYFPHDTTTSVFFAISTKLELPLFTMRPENLYWRLVDLIDGSDIDFENHTTFSFNYHLSGPDEARIRACFKNRFLSIFQSRLGWTMEGNNYFLFLYKKGTLFEERQLTNLYKLGRKLCRPPKAQ